MHQVDTTASTPARAPSVRELPLGLEPVGRDPFLDGLGTLDAHDRQVAMVRASLLVSERHDLPTHRRWA